MENCASDNIAFLLQLAVFKNFYILSDFNLRPAAIVAHDNIKNVLIIFFYSFQALNGFLMILTCEGEVFFATHSIENYLGFHQVYKQNCNIIYGKFYLIFFLDFANFANYSQI